MKVFLISDYFYPFNPGGAEWSVFELAKSLQSKRIEIKVISLNYGTRSREVYKGLEIERLDFPKKLKSFRSVVNPIWQNNPLFSIYSSFKLLQLIKKEKPDVIHVHGKFLIPPAVIAGKLHKVPTIVTIRDKQILCPIGRCFFETYDKKACNFYDYITRDLPWFWKNYVSQKNLYSFLYTIFGAIWNKIGYSIIKFFAKNADAIVAISRSQRDYLHSNGFSDVKVIYNTAQIQNINPKVSNSKKIMFVGKISKGKGAKSLLDTILESKFPFDLKLMLAGEPDSSISKAYFKKLKHQTKVKLLGSIDHNSLKKIYKSVTAVIVPSIYPEAFGRVALEAQSSGIPVIASDKGALKEIIRDRITGRVVKVNKENLLEAIIDVSTNEKQYKDNIKDSYDLLKKTFEIEPITKHVQLYRSLLK